MKSKMKGLISLLIALVLTISGAVMAIGATVSEEDFEVIVTTDKSTYEAGEKIKLSFSIKNNSTDVEVTNVSWSGEFASDGTFQTAKNYKVTISFKLKDNVNKIITTSALLNKATINGISKVYNKRALI